MPFLCAGFRHFPYFTDGDGPTRWLSSKESACKAGDAGLTLGWEGPLAKEMATHLQYSCQESPMNRGALWANVYGVAKNRTQLSD